VFLHEEHRFSRGGWHVYRFSCQTLMP